MNAWLKRKQGPDEVIRVIPDFKTKHTGLIYDLYLAYEPEHLGQILFDADGYWIYDGDLLTIAEQEQMARFIIHNMELLLDN